MTPTGWQHHGALPLEAEIATLRASIAADADNGLCWLKLARLLAFGNRHDEAGDVARRGSERFPQLHALRIVLGECANVAGEPDRALKLLDALPGTLAPNTLAHALHERGAAEEELGRPAAAERSYREALAIQPAAPRPCKSLHMLLRERGESRAILASCASLEKQGVRHARLRADAMIATALSGGRDDALEMFAFGRFAEFQDLGDAVEQDGWADINSFNRAIEVELSTHPDVQYGRRHTASRNAWRVQNPFSGFGRPALNQLGRYVRDAAMAYAEGIQPSEHFFTQVSGDTLSCSSWAVKARGDGFEDWHVHPSAWLTGVYYVRVPPPLAPDDRGGCITFGLPDYAGMPDAGRDWVTIRPYEGLLALFPSHCFHRTWATQRDEDRWIVAFDVMPIGQ